MNARFDFRLRPFHGLGPVMAMAWLGTTVLASAETSAGNSLPPMVQAAFDEPWPAVGLVLAPAPDLQPLGQRPVQPWQLEDQRALPLHFGTEKVLMQFRSGENTLLGPVIDLTQSLPDAPNLAGGTTEMEPEAGPWRLGNVSFNRTAESFNLGKTDDFRKDDLSRQLGKVGGSPQIAASIPITGWAIAGVALLFILVAMAIGNYEGDKDDRKRRKKARRHRHRHTS